MTPAQRESVRVYLLVAALAVLLLLATGCAYLRPAADQAGRAIAHYCAEAPYAVRLETRAAVNAAAAPHSARITCAGDPADP